MASSTPPIVAQRSGRRESATLQTDGCRSHLPAVRPMRRVPVAELALRRATDAQDRTGPNAVSGASGRPLRAPAPPVRLPVEADATLPQATAGAPGHDWVPGKRAAAPDDRRAGLPAGHARRERRAGPAARPRAVALGHLSARRDTAGARSGVGRDRRPA